MERIEGAGEILRLFAANLPESDSASDPFAER
jgi:hypothetical protein